MPTEFVLGPYIESVTEPDPATPPPGKIGVAFAADKPTEPGGKVNLTLAPGAPPDIRPVNVYACFVSPPTAVPAADSRTADWFFKSGMPMQSVAVPPAPAEVGPLQIVVPGVKPGLHFVQTILEYPAAG